MILCPIHESNDCHTPAGSPAGGQFCSKEYGRHKTLGKAVDTALDAALARGATLPRRVQIAGGKSNNTAMYSASNDLLWVSPRVSTHLARVKPGALADPTLAGTINHELGHKEHSDAVGDRYDNIKNVHIPADLRTKIRIEVSRYAATNGLEFVAEVYSGQAAGRVYSEDIMRFYRLLGGVER